MTATSDLPALTETDAERHLQELDLEILSDKDIANWNILKDAALIYERDMEPAKWRKEDDQLVKEFYVSDRSGEFFGIYRKAWYGNFDGTFAPTIYITDNNCNILTVRRTKGN